LTLFIVYPANIGLNFHNLGYHKNFSYKIVKELFKLTIFLIYLTLLHLNRKINPLKSMEFYKTMMVFPQCSNTSQGIVTGRVHVKKQKNFKKKKTDPNLKSLMMTRASRPPVSRISSSVTRKAREIQETEGRKRRKVRE
jgi:hypothetical protein